MLLIKRNNNNLLVLNIFTASAALLHTLYNLVQFNLFILKINELYVQIIQMEILYFNNTCYH